MSRRHDQEQARRAIIGEPKHAPKIIATSTGLHAYVRCACGWTSAFCPRDDLEPLVTAHREHLLTAA